jgi:Ala-tRNA(Pro) deacylase
MGHATETDLFARLLELGIESTTHRHPPVFTVEESRLLRGQLPGAHCKSLFLKDKKDQLWLVVALERQPVDLKMLPKNIGAARLSFGKPEVLIDILGVEPGSVTPFALINDDGGRVRVVLDKAMLDHDLLNYHPLKNTATTALAAADLVRFIRSCGHDPLILDFDDLI